MIPDAWIHCNEDGSFPGADGYPVDDGDSVYVLSPWPPLHHRMQRVDYFHGGPFNPVFQTVHAEIDMLSTEVINVHPDNPSIYGVTKLQRLWRARRQETSTMNIHQVGVTFARAYFCAADWTRWRDYHNHRWWHCQRRDKEKWFYENLPWSDVRGQCSNGMLEPSVLLHQEASGAYMPLWGLLCITAHDATRLAIMKHDGDCIALHAGPNDGEITSGSKGWMPPWDHVAQLNMSCAH